MSITFDKNFILKFFLILILNSIVAGKIFAQNDSGATLADSLQKAFEISVLNHSQDSLRQTDAQLRNFSFERSQKSYQRWKDQFPSLFIVRFNGLPVPQPIELPIENDAEEWKFWLSLFLLAFLAFIRFTYPKDFEELKQTFKNWGLNQQMIRELGVGVPLGTVLLNIFSSVVISLYAFLILEYFKTVIIHPPWLMLIFSFLFVETGLLFRYIFLKSAEFIFPFKKELKLFNYYEIQLNRIFGIYLFPFVLIIAFSIPPFTTIAMFGSLIMVAMMFAVRYIKGFNIGMSYFGNHIIHFLLYICALEIAPVLIVIRLLLKPWFYQVCTIENYENEISSY